MRQRTHTRFAQAQPLTLLNLDRQINVQQSCEENVKGEQYIHWAYIVHLVQ